MFRSRQSGGATPFARRVPVARSAEYHDLRMVRQAGNPGLWRWAAGTLLIAVLVATLRPGNLATESWIHRCLICGPFGVADAVRNVLLFVPLGFVLPRVLGSYRRALLAMVALTVCIEAGQIIIPGRDSSPVDVLFNSLGGALGAGVFATLGAWLPYRPRPRYGLLFVYVALLLGAVAVFGQGAKPTFPEGTLIGQWAPVRLEYVPFSGLIHSADIEGAPVPAWAIPNGRRTFSQFLDGRPLNVRFTRGTFDRGIQLLVRVVMPSQTELLMIGIKGDGVVVRPRTHFTRWRVFEPITEIPDVLASTATGDDVEVAVFRNNDRYCASVGSRTECVPAVTPGRLWTVGVNVGRWPPSALVLGVATLLILAGWPLGWWGGALAGAFSGLAVGGGWAAIASQSALGWASWEAGALLVGVAIGVGLRKTRQNQSIELP